MVSAPAILKAEKALGTRASLKHNSSFQNYANAGDQTRQTLKNFMIKFSKFLFYGISTRPEKVLTKNIRRVRDLEDRILCLRAMATYGMLFSR